MKEKKKPHHYMYIHNFIHIHVKKRTKKKNEKKKMYILKQKNKTVHILFSFKVFSCLNIAYQLYFHPLKVLQVGYCGGGVEALYKKKREERRKKK